MKTNQQIETEVVLSMMEAIRALEQQLSDAQKRISDMELIISNQRAAIKELQ